MQEARKHIDDLFFMLRGGNSAQGFNFGPLQICDWSKRNEAYVSAVCRSRQAMCASHRRKVFKNSTIARIKVLSKTTSVLATTFRFF